MEARKQVAFLEVGDYRIQVPDEAVNLEREKVQDTVMAIAKIMPGLRVSFVVDYKLIAQAIAHGR